jgi:hypothetical protein
MALTQDQQAIAVTGLMRRIGLGPLVRLHIKDWDDRSTWGLSPDADVTAEQREAARAVIDAYDPAEFIASEEARRAAVHDDAARRQISELIRTKTAGEIDKWLSKNVRTVAQARKVLGALIKFLIVPR